MEIDTHNFDESDVRLYNTNAYFQRSVDAINHGEDVVNILRQLCSVIEGQQNMLEVYVRNSHSRVFLTPH